MIDHHTRFPLVRVVFAIFLGSVFSMPSPGQGYSSGANATPSNAAAIPGHLSSDELKAIFAAADEEDRRAFLDLVRQTSALSGALLSIQERDLRQYPQHRSHWFMQALSELQRRLGKSLEPKRVEDIVEMNQMLMKGAPIFSQVAPPNSREISSSVNQAVANEKQRLQQADAARNVIAQVESALDNGDLSRANQLFHMLAGTPSALTFAQSYLQKTESLRQDLDAYSQAVEIGKVQAVSLSDHLKKLSREVSLLHENASDRPLSQAYLQHAAKDDIDVSRRQLADLPGFEFNEESYKIPTGISESDELAFASGHIKTLEESLAEVSEVRAIVAHPETMKTIAEVIGGSESVRFKATADQIAAAENTRESLVQAQNSIQTKIAEESNARGQAEAAIEAKRQSEAGEKAESMKAQDEGIASFLGSNIPDSDDNLGISNRVVRIQDDDLVVEQIVTNDQSGGPANTTIRVRLSETFLAQATGTEVAITCDAPRDNRGNALTLNRQVDCVRLNVGVYAKGMTGIRITNVPNAAEVSRMLDRLIQLHHKTRYSPR